MKASQKVQEWERAELKKYPQELEAFQNVRGNRFL